MFCGELPGTGRELAKTNHYICGRFDSQNLSLCLNWKQMEKWMENLIIIGENPSLSTEGIMTIRMRNADYVKLTDKTT